MPEVLIVDDSRVLSTMVRQRIEDECGLKTRVAASYAEALTLMDEMKTSGDAFCSALLDLNLPDAPNGAIVDAVVERGIPSIVFTGDFSDETQDLVWGKRVVDYVLKEGTQNIDYVIDLIKRIRRNRLIKVLVVDDSSVARCMLMQLLSIHQYQVFEAASGEDALLVIRDNPDIALVFVDFNMPGMDGFELTKTIRQKYDRRKMAIIGISALGGNKLSAKFIKSGANDFVNKPFSVDEFYCRVTQNIEMIEHVRAIQHASDTDYLTGLHNRRFLYESGKTLYENARRGHISLTVAMVDVDHFKHFNDAHGHDAGDMVLKQLAGVLRSQMRAGDIVARFGGEEFCILAINMEPGHAFSRFDRIRQDVEELPLEINGGHHQVTVSIGVCTRMLDSLEAMIHAADSELYRAKRTGRNRVDVIQ